MQKTEVSVIITTHNRPKLLKRAIDSVLAQTYRYFLLYIIDDASNDETRKLVSEYFDKCTRVNYIRLEQNQGLAKARNKGLEISEGQFIAFLDDDDWWKPQCLEKRMNILNSLPGRELKRLGVVYCGCEIQLTDSGEITYNMPQIIGSIRENIIAKDISTIPSSCLFSREALEKAGLFDESLVSSIDHDIWMSLAKQGFNAYAVNEPHVVTYESTKRNAMMTDTEKRIRGVEQYLEKWSPVYREWLGDASSSKYIKKYRRRVLVRMAATKILSGKPREVRAIFRHILSKGHNFIFEALYVSRLIFLQKIKMVCPKWFARWVRKKKKLEIV